MPVDSRYILGGAVEICATRIKEGVKKIEPRFRLVDEDAAEVMIRGGDFYAAWIPDLGLWSKKELDLVRLIDRELKKYADEYRQQADPDERVYVDYMVYTDTKIIDRWHSYCKSQSRDIFHPLDEKLVFANDAPNKNDYASKRLSYPLEPGPAPSYDKLMSVLYSEEERHKIEWAIGSIVSGDSRTLQKFMVLYGAAGTGKSTVLNIIEQLFDGYYCVFDAKALGDRNNQFPLEPFKGNPLVGIQHDGDLSRIEDNTILNSLVSHELMPMNTKNKSIYESRIKAFLFMGTNRPVKITDAKSGLLRRLIDVSPSGNKLPIREYTKAVNNIQFELGHIAWHCLEVYKEDPHYYDGYVPLGMMGATNDFFNFVADSYYIFAHNNGTTLSAAWKLYTQYCEDARVQYPMSRRVFGEELKNYFDECKERFSMEDGSRVRSYYTGFRRDIFEQNKKEEKPKLPDSPAMNFIEQKSILDDILKDCPAQYASSEGTPMQKWAYVNTKLSDLDTTKLHYVKVPGNHIVIDFDIPDENGNKSLERNIQEASKWPETYAELSKSGCGIHLHYIYDGDPSKLALNYAEHIEIKTSKGNSSLRRKLTKCINAEVAHINSGLPTKGVKQPMLNSAAIRSERDLRRRILKVMDLARNPDTPDEKRLHTKPAIDLIKKILDETYDSGLKYDIADMRNAIFGFGASSSHQSDYCIRTIQKMRFRSEAPPEGLPDNEDDEKPIAFFDCEVFPNLFVVCWKIMGEDQMVHAMVNPTKEQVDSFIESFRLIGFNNRKYDNHIIYARSIGVSIEGLYKLSDSIINRKEGFQKQAYDISYTDIYDFSSKKQSLKKFEIELRIDHKELDIPWDQPVPEDRIWEVVEYCKNDVIATEAVFNARKADFAGRKILAKLAGGTVNDTTNSLSTRFIFGKEKNPQSQFNYRNMGEIPEKVYRSKIDAETGVIFHNLGDEYTLFDEEGRPVFPGYTFESTEVVNEAGARVRVRKSMYRGEEVGEGGYVYAEPGMYGNVALLDIESMHPHSVIAEKLFGDYFTERFEQIVKARLAIKHKDIDSARTMLNGELVSYLDDPEMLEGLKQALKIVINSVYGLTSAGFVNPFRDPRNEDNIVAKRGALFMVNLKHEVQKRGFTVAHIKTDSIKIPNATPEIIKFVQDYGEQYGYHFLHEATYERMCLVNDAVYIAKYDTAEAAEKKYGYVPVDLNKHGGEWTATGAQFAVPYVFKMLFTKEPIEFDDMCETKSVTSSMVLDMNENLPEDEHHYVFVGRVGRFCPVIRGAGGGLLMRVGKNKKTGEVTYSAVAGTKDYRWFESEVVKINHMEDKIDREYYNRLVNEAADTISKYGDIEMFLSDDPYEVSEYLSTAWPNIDIPPWEAADHADIFLKQVS
jgi:hypothetical protein